ncbi:MAG: GNAT family N-acetyltransferase [Bacteroidetes bacterium]|nr:GNAT family N-acetyltransferase [Bacteroidota bacterium]
MIITITERLLIRELSVSDSAFILELVNSPSWLKFIGDRGVKNLDDAKSYLKKGPLKSYDDNGFGLYWVGLRDSNTPIGMCGVIKRADFESPDIGFAFLPEYEGKGYGYESASAILDYCKTEFHIKKIVGITLEENTASIRLLEKLGLTFEKKFIYESTKEELLLYTLNY